MTFNTNWHEGCPFWIRICQLNFYQKYPIWKVQIDINRVILTLCQAHWFFKKMTQGCAKD